MGNSFQDQFLKLGLVDKKQVNKIKKKKHQQKKAKVKSPEPDESKILAEKAQEQKKKRAQERNRKKNEKIKQKESAAQIHQLIENNRIQYDEGEIPYNFTDYNKVKRLLLSKEIADKLGSGKLAIVRQAGVYHIIPADIARKVQEFNRKMIVLLHKPKEISPEADDPYAEFQVPDDLMW